MRKAKSLVKTGADRFSGEVNGSLNRLKGYSFFDPQNEEQARGLAEATFHAFANKEKRQALIQARELSLLVNYDRSLKAIDILNDRGVNAKPFCFHNSLSDKKDMRFDVKGSDFDWHIEELSESNERIPVEFIRNVSYLRLNGLKIDGLAIATPLEQKPIKEIIKEEFRNTGAGFRKAMGVIMHALLLPFTMLIEDPILLIRFGDPNIGSYYVEAGRWL